MIIRLIILVSLKLNIMRKKYIYFSLLKLCGIFIAIFHFRQLNKAQSNHENRQVNHLLIIVLFFIIVLLENVTTL